MAVPQAEAADYVPSEDRVTEWARKYAKLPNWKKLNENTWHIPSDGGDQEREPQRRRFPEPPAKGTNPKYDKIQEQRKKLIIAEYKKAIVDMVMANPVTVLCGETGCGKSTQVAQYLVEAGFADKGCIAVTEPRRVAAMSLARRVAEEANVKLSEEVGYKIRFDPCVSEKSFVQYMTDGVLLRECVNKPDLAKYSVVIVDEAHERSINIDVLLGLLKGIVRVRGDFKIVIMSATIDIEKFSSFFRNAPTLSIPGKTHNVQLFHTDKDDNFTMFHKPSENNLIEAVCTTVDYILEEAEPHESGDILIFLYGQEIIEQVCRELRQNSSEIYVLPLYRSLSMEKQNLIFEPAPQGKRKVIVSTNVAESALTIDGVRYVIDSGFMKVMTYYALDEVESLEVCTISHEHATQRAGRAGRTQPGSCYRLYSEDYYKNKMLKHHVPEILRSNLVGTLLQIKATGVGDLLTFDYIDPPRKCDMIQAHLELLKLNAIKVEGNMTVLGEKISFFPIEPTLSKLILYGAYTWKCSQEMAAIASMLSCLPVLLRPREDKVEDVVAEENVDLDVSLDEEDEDDVRNVVAKLLDKTVAVCDEKTGKRTPSATKETFATSNIPFYRPEGDLVAMLYAWRAFLDNDCSSEWCFANSVMYRSMIQAKEIYDQLIRIMEKKKVPILTCGADMEPVQRTIANVMHHNLAVKSVDDNKKVAYHPLSRSFPYPISRSSVLRASDPDYVIFTKLTRRGKTFMSDVTAVKPEWFSFKLPPPYSLDVDRDGYKEFVMFDKKQENAMTDRIRHTYNPKRYGPCPLEALHGLRKRLEDERKAKWTSKLMPVWAPVHPLRPLPSDDTDEWVAANVVGAGWYEMLPMTEDRFPKNVYTSSPEHPPLPKMCAGDTSLPEVMEYILPPPPEPPILTENAEKEPSPPLFESVVPGGKTRPAASKTDPREMTREEFEREEAEIDDLMERALNEDLDALNLLFDLEPGVDYMPILAFNCVQGPSAASSAPAMLNRPRTSTSISWNPLRCRMPQQSQSEAPVPSTSRRRKPRGVKHFPPAIKGQNAAPRAQPRAQRVPVRECTRRKPVVAQMNEKPPAEKPKRKRKADPVPRRSPEQACTEARRTKLGR
ncbi:hypothetical protein QR680_010236 [Steinernema hermaphroditum]|uniref:RNA helicase n=1 Tax=Steinernema hermaphroditum TaxID=289476 RepID=A0AA39MB76_9BILA|nr:hypothetical protein QR680_010236 [Steinernema hermaphroditum]